MKSIFRGLLSNNSLQRVAVKVVTELKPLLKKIQNGKATLRVGSEMRPADFLEFLQYLLEGANHQLEGIRAPLIWSVVVSKGQ